MTFSSAALPLALLAFLCLSSNTPEADPPTARAFPDPPDVTAGRCCMTDPDAWCRDDPARIERRFRLYREMGVDTLRVALEWRALEPEEGRWDAERLRPYFDMARKHGFRLKLILGDIMAPPAWFFQKHPDARITDENGRTSPNTVSYWWPGLRPLLREKAGRLFEILKDLRAQDMVESVIPAFGPAGEPLYPVPWTLGADDIPQTYWCYDAHAQRDFRARMRSRYGRLERANARWGTTFGAWDAVRVLPPGRQPGPYWEDVLTWYRDTKRDFIRRQIDDVRRLAGAGRRILLYVPGTGYTDAEWHEAVRTAQGGDAVKMMADSRFLMDMAAEKGCWLQYTGVDNAPEVARLRGYMRGRGRVVPMWGENAGVLGAARDPLALARTVVENGLVGLDYTHAHFAFEPDGVTPNAVFPQLIEAYSRIREAAREGQPAAQPLTREEVIEKVMKPYSGPRARGVDPKTLTGKVMCGYQGWFTAEGDGAERGWFHWAGPDGFKPGSCKIDMWPDVSDLDPNERFATSFRHADGRVAEVFSSYNKKTVLRHFRWMRDYGIDGAFVQRFTGETFHPHGLRQSTTVLGHCREGANRYGRTYAVMYDLSGMGVGQMGRVMEDWRLLVDRMRITKDPAYLHHNGSPVVAVWGIGFNDNRRYTLEECLALVEFLKSDPRYGGCTVMLGVPTGWRTLDADSVKDPALHDLIRRGDIVSPWTVGRFGTPEQAARHAETRFKPDIAWCRVNGKEYLPVVFPGFSWNNMFPNSKLDLIPRLGGRFLWAQYAGAKRAGAAMIYQAMFDEVDEGTAIFKCTNDPPVGASRFVTYEGLPTDHYLWLVGQGGRMLRGEIPLSDELPRREAGR